MANNSFGLNPYNDIFHFELGLLAKNRRSLSEIVVGIGKFVKHVVTIFDLIRMRSSIEPQPELGSVWCVISSKNNFRSVAFLKDQIKGLQYIAINSHSQKLEPSALRMRFHRAVPFLFKLPVVIIQLMSRYGLKPLVHFDIVAKTIGIHESFPSTIEKYQPKAIIFPNDHYPRIRALIHAAKRSGIPTIYIQHASVSESFPPLIFDLNLLEGQDTLTKYQTQGEISGRVELIGMPRFDQFANSVNKRIGIKKIGVTPSVLDKRSIIESLVTGLSTSLKKHGIEVHFRPHPRDERSFKFQQDIKISDPGKESGLEFISKVDTIVAGVTSIHLEAIMLNVPSLHYDMDGFHTDFYDYVKNGLVDEYKSIEDLVEAIELMIHDRPDVQHKARRYNAVIGTEKEGHSQELAVQSIQDFVRVTSA